MLTTNGPSFDPEVNSEEEWEAKWEEFIRLAREYGWPEDYLKAFLETHRVSYQERLKSIEKARQLWESKNQRESIFEDKRTRLREPMSPAERNKIRALFDGSTEE
jgi:hypothetical protein